MHPCLPMFSINSDALDDAGLKGSLILVLGISYKKNVDDMRESPSVELMELFRAKGTLVHYSDPSSLHFLGCVNIPLS